MILTTHAITGAAVASAMPNHPVLGFTAGFVSHFLLDAIPHWDYELRSSKKNPNDDDLTDDILIDKNSFGDLLKISADFLFGFIMVFFLFFNSPIFASFHISFFKSSVFWGMTGGLLPDFLQFVYFKIWRREPLKSMQKFHGWIQKNKHLINRPILGISTQIILIVAIVSIFKFVF
jgi:hypothetical protein